MKYLNAAETARALGIGDKTIRRWLKAGRFPSAIVKANGEYAIPESDVEELKQHRIKYVHAKSTSHDQSDVSILAEKLAALEQEVAELRKGQSLPSEKGKGPSMEEKPIERTTPTLSPQKRNVARADGSMRLADFSKSSGIPLRTLHNWREAGKIETTHDNRPSGGGIEYFISAEQQEKARMIDSLRTTRKSSKFPPDGCITTVQLANQYSVPYSDIQFQATIGLGPGTTEDKEQLQVTKDKRGDYLTPEQQTAAIQYWRKYGVHYQM